MTDRCNKKVLFAISDSFPYGAAYAARTRALCKLFQSVGYETAVLCDYPSKGIETKEYGGIITVSDKPYTGIAKLFFLPLNYQAELKKVLKKTKYDIVVSRSMFDRFDGVLRIVREFNIPIILESCEWYDVKGFARGKHDIRYMQFQHCFKHSYNKVDGVIAISRLLEEHYLSKGIRTIRIPGIHEVSKLPYRIDRDKTSSVSFVFAGAIYGGKESFEDFIIALSKVDFSFSLNIYGPKKDEVEENLTDHGKECLHRVIKNVNFYGKIPQEEMPKVCSENDFGVFFRPDRRSSHAGFPTKLGEYLSGGTPVITNDTGDITMVVTDGNNGYIVNRYGVEGIKEVLDLCSALSREEYEKMRRSARQSAEDKLDYSVYKELLFSFLDSISR